VIDGITIDGIDSLLKYDSKAANLARQDCSLSEENPDEPECPTIAADQLNPIDRD